MTDTRDNPFSLAGRVAVITGAGSGIGRGAAIAFARAGALLVLADIDDAGLAETARLVGGDPELRRIDVGCRADVDALADAAIARFGRIDAWANVAGITGPSAMLDASEELLDRVIAVNLKGVFWGAVAAARAMKAQGSGSIINVSSTGAIGAPPTQAIYSVTKAGVDAITRNLAVEVGRVGIRVNTVSPGYVETPLGSSRFRRPDGSIDPEMREKIMAAMRASNPLGITGEPEDIAHAMIYLASDASRYMTGQNLYVNGGTTLG